MGTQEHDDSVPPAQRRHHHLQRRYYRRRHEYLSLADTPYVRKCVRLVAQAANLRPHHRVLEVGSGRGRFTVPMLNAGFDLTCVEPSPELAEALRSAAGTRVRRILGESVENLPASEDKQYHRVIGFYILHHIDNLDTALSRILRLLLPGGCAVFLEPNPWNPLFAMQYTFCRDFSWRAEWRTYAMFPSRLRRIAWKQGFTRTLCSRFGLLPPGLYNRPLGQRVEEHVERIGPLRKLLPYQVLTFETA